MFQYLFDGATSSSDVGAVPIQEIDDEAKLVLCESVQE